jgi:hypothetical protein
MRMWIRLDSDGSVCAVADYLKHVKETSDSIRGGDILEQLSYDCTCTKYSFVQIYSIGETL